MSRLQREIKRLKVRIPHKNKYEGMGENGEDKLTKFKSQRLPRLKHRSERADAIAKKIACNKHDLCTSKAKYNATGALKKVGLKTSVEARQCPWCHDWHVFKVNAKKLKS